MQFTLNDFATAVEQVRKLGGLRETLQVVLPEFAEHAGREANHEKEMRHVLAMIRSMTKDEREYPDQIHPNRARRIARGSGTDPKDVDDLVRQFLRMRQFMEKMASNWAWETDNPHVWSTVPFERKIWPLK